MKQKELQKLLAQFEPRIRKAFAASIAEITSKVVLQEVIAALQAGLIEQAVEALHIEPAAFSALAAEQKAAFVAGGETGVAEMPRTPEGRRLIVRFDANHALAEQWMATKAAEKIALLVAEQREVARTVLVAGLQEGNNPLVTALDLIGRIDPQTGRRTGGIIGLSQPQAQWVLNARRELTTLELMEQYFERTRRDRRYDGVVRDAIKEGRTLTDDELARLLGRYSDRLLQTRGEAIARTESLGALHAGNRNAYEQAISAGNLREADIIRVWDATGDAKVRPSHRELDGVQVGFNEPYKDTPEGPLMFPGDPDGPPSEIINCRCNELYRIDFLGRARRLHQRMVAEGVA